MENHGARTLRKIPQQFILASLMISLTYCLFAILTLEPQANEVSSAHDRIQRKGKIPSYKQRFAHADRPSMDRRAEDIPRQNMVDAILQQTSQVAGRPVLVNYLTQLGPADKHELMNVLNVAAEARNQLLSDQVATNDSMTQARQSLAAISQGLDGEFNIATSQYLDNLNRRREIRREMAFQEEEIQGLNVETGSGFHRSQELTEAHQSFQALQAQLDAVQTAITDYEARLGGPDTRKILGNQYPSFHEGLEAYKRGLEAALDQDVILDKFDSIFAVMSNVHLDEI
jgi:hypothetical protein